MRSAIKPNRRRCAFAVWYTVVLLSVLCLFVSLGADFGRVQLAKTQLRRIADSAARAGAHGLSINTDAARAEAQKYASLNVADGRALVLDANDIEFGTWSIANKSFTKLTGFSAGSSNSVRIIARRSHADGTGVPLLFAGVAGQGTCDVWAESIAMLIPAVDVDQYVPATANPFLAGMPPGTVASLNNPHNSPDYAGSSTNPGQSPLAVNLPITDGQTVTFDSIDGTARHDPNLPYFNPDGELTDIGHNTNGSENGIADMNAPINALVGLFLDDSAPDTTPTPPKLDFSTSASRDFNSLEPKLKQMFFIGDGKNSSGQHQEFKAPRGATRLYLATWDFYEWNNNAGYRNIKVNRPEQIVTVK